MEKNKKIRMTENLDHRKYKLIKEIMSIEDEAQLSKLEVQMDEIQGKSSLWQKVIAPTKDSISLKEMIKEQNYKPISKEEFFQMAEELEIEESLEDLLAQLD